jgi:hypothetical protein
MEEMAHGGHTEGTESRAHGGDTLRGNMEGNESRAHGGHTRGHVEW